MDKNLYFLLREYGIKDLRQLGRSRSPEIFEVGGDSPIELIKSKVEQALEQLKTGIRPFSKQYNPRPHQRSLGIFVLSLNCLVLLKLIVQ